MNHLIEPALEVLLLSATEEPFQMLHKLQTNTPQVCRVVTWCLRSSIAGKEDGEGYNELVYVVVRGKV